MAIYRSLGTLKMLLADTPWPVDFFSPDNLPAFLDHIYVMGYRLQGQPSGFACQMWLALEGELSVKLPGLEGVKLVVAGGDLAGFTFLVVSLVVGDESRLTLHSIRLALRFDSSILKPVALQPGDPVADFAEIQIEGSLSINSSFDISIDGFDAFNLPPAMIGNTGVIISASDVKLDLSRTTTLPEIIGAGFDENFLGVYIGQAQVKLPQTWPALVPKDLVLRNAAIGTGGVSGRLEAHYTPRYDATKKTFTGDGAGQLFGIPFGIKDVALEFRQNTLKEATITGKMLLPFFNEPVDVEMGLTLDGGFQVKLARENGLYTLTKDNILRLQLESLGFEVKDGRLTTIASGQLTPLFGAPGLAWPSFQVKELAIDSDGNVHLEGGWLNLRDQYSLNFHGFQTEITKLGFGKNQDGGKWVGFSGGIRLVDGLSAGASVEGLRIVWYDDKRPTRITMEGVGVELAYPGAFSFKGFVAYRELPGDVHRFEGDIQLQVDALEFGLDGKLVIGSANGSTFLAIVLAAEFPAGIALGATGLSLYSIAGLFALRMVPDKHADEQWYSVDGKSWYHRGTPGVTDLAKWRNQPGGLALGAGATVGTVSDNGYAFSGKMLFAITFPGPVIFFDGRAGVLRERPHMSDESVFRAFGVVDKRAGTVLFGLDAQYKRDSNGKLIDIRGGAEAFFNWKKADDWHLYLGQKEPRDKRIRARVFKLLEADSYLMLDSRQLALGARSSYGRSWKFGPLGVTIEAWMEGNAVISWKPTYFHGDLWLHGKATLHAYRFSAGLTVDARLAADVFDPFHVLGEFKVKIKLPWPFPDPSATVRLEWGPEKLRPPLPRPLQEVAVEHFKVTTSWTLPRKVRNPNPPPAWLPAPRLLLPDYDADDDGFLQPPDAAPAALEKAPAPADAPIVPLDARPHLTFARPVHDDALVGVNAQPVVPDREHIGDPARNLGPATVRYAIKEVALAKYVGGADPWKPVAWAPNADSKTKLFGSWAPVPNMPDGNGNNVAQTKLWLWSKTPFNYTRHSGAEWGNWFASRFHAYPCIPDQGDEEICCEFETIDSDAPLRSPWECPNHHIRVAWYDPVVAEVTTSEGTVEGLCFSYPDNANVIEITITPPEPAKMVRVSVGGIEVTKVDAAGYDANNNPVGTSQAVASDQSITITGNDMVRVVLRADPADPDDQFCLSEICADTGLSDEEASRRKEMEQHIRDELARWSQEDFVLEPHTTYRLKVVTTLDVKGEKELAGYAEQRTQTEYAYFRTEGPPALADLAVPIGYPNPAEFDSGLADLARYVRQTVPPTVPAPGQKPPLPRPVYRAYDVGVEFNENYVDLMYRLERRDLGLYLYDNNNRPVRDGQGHLIVLNSRWGAAEVIMLNESDRRWIEMVTRSGCATIDPTTIARNTTITNATQHVLDQDTFYEARLAPLLLHEDFSGYPAGASANGPSGSLGRWRVSDESTSDRPSHWEVRAEGSPPGYFIVQTANISGGTLDSAPPTKPGTLLLYGDDANPALPGAEQPASWTDYRLSVYLRSMAGDGALGVVFRYRDQNNYYRYLMDRQGKNRQLVRVSDGATMTLVEDQFVYNQNQDYLVSVEAIGPAIRLYQDGALIFDVTDSAIDQGRIGLYCWKNTAARFADVRVDDIRRAAPVAYRFMFTTSRFADFFHHMHSYKDETWPATVATGIDNPAAVELDKLKLFPQPSDDEARAYETSATAVLGPAAPQDPLQVEVTRVVQKDATLDTDALGFLVRSPEPIDWGRTELAIARSDTQLTNSRIPGGVKLTGVTFGKDQPNQESVSLLLLEATDLAGLRIEYRLLADAAANAAWQPYYTFGPEARLVDGTRVQIYAGNMSAAPSAVPGVMQRFVATGTDSGQIRLPADGVELRLVGADGTIGHMRQFLPESAYNPVTAKVLRKADGTGFFALASALAAGSYRLSLTYRRDNRPGDPTSPVLSEAGSSDPEQVTLDIPWETRKGV